MSNIEQLRETLFETLNRLNGSEATPEELSIEINRAKAVQGVAQTIINTAKLELDFIKTTKSTGKESKFFGRMFIAQESGIPLPTNPKNIEPSFENVRVLRYDFEANGQKDYVLTMKEDVEDVQVKLSNIIDLPVTISKTEWVNVSIEERRNKSFDMIFASTWNKQA